MVVAVLWASFYVVTGSTLRLVVGCACLALALGAIVAGAWAGMDLSFWAAGRALQ